MKRSRLTAFVLLIGWLLSLGVVYILGLFTAFAFHQAPGEGGTGGMALEDRAYAVLVGQLLEAPVDWPQLKSGSPETAVPEQVAALLIALNREEDAARRSLAAETIAGAYPSRKVVPAIQRLLEESPSAGPRALLEALFERWGQIDGRSAMDFTRTVLAAHPQAAAFSRSALAGWASARSETAWRWVSQHPSASKPLQAERFATVLAHARELSEPTIIEWLGGLDAPALREAVASAEAVRRFRLEGPRSAFAFGEAATDSYESRVAVLSAVMEAWAKQDAATARGWYEGLSSEDRGWALPALAKVWSEDEPAAALAWLGGQSVSGARAIAMREVSRSWVEAEGPVPLGEFLNNAESLGTYSPAIEILALETMHVDPETAFSWASLIADADRRRFTAAMVALSWMAVDPTAASQAISRSTTVNDQVLQPIAESASAAGTPAETTSEAAPVGEEASENAPEGMEDFDGEPGDAEDEFY